MSRSVKRRIQRLEALKPERPFRALTSLEQDDTAFEAWRSGLVASGEAHEDYKFIRVIFVSPPGQQADSGSRLGQFGVGAE